MANQEHLDLLKQGVTQWNEWRVQHPGIRPDLTKADLRFAKLSDANLRGAKLSDANLGGANLGGADLNIANLSGARLSRAKLNIANLSGARLSGANLAYSGLNGADLRFAKLSGANLSGANLYDATLSDATLSRASLHRAVIGYTVLARVDLREVKGLSEINHVAPSFIELHTIQLPPDGSALHFLRGCGVPDEWIDFWRSTMLHPIQYYSCFISYSSKDEMLAKRLHADLQAHGVRCWFAPHDIRPGDYFREAIDKAIHVQEKLLLILSQDSVTSKWVKYEVNRALDREAEQERTILFPIRLDETVLHCATDWAADLRTHRHIGDFTNWSDPQAYQQAFERLLRDLKKQ